MDLCTGQCFERGADKCSVEIMAKNIDEEISEALVLGLLMQPCLLLLDR